MKGDKCAVAIDECMVALKWADKRQVPMLSTVHDDSMLTKVRRTRHADGGREGGGKEASDGRGL